MENTQEYSPPHMDASRPSLGFPLGTALLLIIIFSLSGIFSCCYHWDKHRSLRRSLANASGHPSAASADIESSPLKPRLPFPDLKKNQNLSVTVLMPGDNTPKFIALPCPCAPPRPENLTVDVQSPPHSPPVKPPRFPLPLC
ncbi:BnaA09g07150D [Brassica napus]|uniref:BnaA09g07150D protein n=1 Tax=Brassica napus TaxID=3708 RepID=A0A078FW84_BRANA|nr:BnaA09g07150D [Brassica napus]